MAKKAQADDRMRQMRELAYEFAAEQADNPNLEVLEGRVMEALMREADTAGVDYDEGTTLDDLLQRLRDTEIPGDEQTRLAREQNDQAAAASGELTGAKALQITGDY